MLPDRATRARRRSGGALCARLRGPAGARAARRARTATRRRLRHAVLPRAAARWSTWCVAHRCDRHRRRRSRVFVGALALFRFVPQQFFPSSSRLELLVDLRLPEGSSFAATLAAAKKLESDARRRTRASRASSRTSAAGTPRFYLPLDQQLQQAEFRAVRGHRQEQRGARALRARLLDLFDERLPASCAAACRGWRTGRRSASRCSSASRARTSRRCAAIARAGGRRDARRSATRRNVQFDWDEPSKVIRLAIDQNKARVLGISSQELATFLNNSLSGFSVTYYRERDKQIEVRPARRRRRARADELPQGPRDPDARAAARCRSRRSPTSATSWRTASSGAATGCRRSPCAPTCAATRRGPTSPSAIDRELDALRAALPLGYRIELGGAIEDSARGQKSIVAGVPLLRASPC